MLPFLQQCYFSPDFFFLPKGIAYLEVHYDKFEFERDSATPKLVLPLPITSVVYALCVPPIWALKVFEKKLSGFIHDDWTYQILLPVARFQVDNWLVMRKSGA